MYSVLNWLNENSGLILHYGIQAVVALVIFLIGSRVAKFCSNLTEKGFAKKKVDKAVGSFVASIVFALVFAVTILMALSQIGIETTSFIAILGAAGLAVGLALQGSLANFAGGVLIMIFKPIKLGDLIEAQGEIGVVKEIEIFTTKLTGLSNKEIIIPNGTLSNGNIINYSTEGTRRVDLTIGVSYDADIKQTKEVLLKVLTSNPKVLQDPAPAVTVSELADSSVNFAVRPWSKTEHYWDVYFEVTEAVKLELDKAGIEIPYPHQVNVKK